MPEPASAAQPGAPEPAGELLAGRYRVNGLLGRGGMSEVYHGYDKQLDRRVAIKVLRPPANAPTGPSSPEAVEALAELRAVRPLLVDAYGEQSTLVRNLDKQSGRLSMDPALDG
jgi:serine/threonine protein kinase